MQTPTQIHQAQANIHPDRSSLVKVKGGKFCRVPGGTMKTVGATCSQHQWTADALFEPLSIGLPAVLLTSLVQVARDTVYIPVVNVGTLVAILYPYTVLGSLSQGNLMSSPTGLEEMSATISTQTTSSMQDRIAAVDLTAPTEQEQHLVRSLLQKYSSVFSAHGDNIGCPNLISHNIPLIDEVLVRRRYWAHSPFRISGS